MSTVRVAAFSVSIDGYGAGPDQALAHPLGIGAESLHDWMVSTRTFQRMVGGEDGTTGADDDWAARSMAGMGAWIMGRNMFGPVRGPWPDYAWKGWWGDNPPYHVPVFVLTHHARPPIEMAGGTVFHFVTEGIETALDRARAAAGERDVRVGGGVSTVRQYLEAGLIDEMHLAVSPMLLGRGENLFAGLDLLSLGFETAERTVTDKAIHILLTRTG